MEKSKWNEREKRVFGWLVTWLLACSVNWLCCGFEDQVKLTSAVGISPSEVGPIVMHFALILLLVVARELDGGPVSLRGVYLGEHRVLLGCTAQLLVCLPLVLVPVVSVAIPLAFPATCCQVGKALVVASEVGGTHWMLLAQLHLLVTRAAALAIGVVPKWRGAE